MSLLPSITGARTGAPLRNASTQRKKNPTRSRHASPPVMGGDDDGDVLDESANGTVSSSCVSAAADRRDASDFRILVAARIRPFTEREVRQWRQERRAAEAQEGDAEEARRAKAALRQPFGPGHRSLNATQTGLDVTWSHRRHDDNGSPHDRASLDVDDVPLPVVEVESDGTTIAILDAQHLSGDGLTNAPVRNAFTYDFVYSSFAPNVELDAQLTDVNAHGRGGSRNATAASYVIMDGDDAPASSHAPSTHTPAQEQQAEAEQVVIFQQLAVPLVEAALHGYNTCMFAYGQTGSGKTYTMMGTDRHPGLIPRLCQLLFAEVAARNGVVDGRAASTAAAAAQAPVSLQLSYMEIYNEQVRDLLKQRPKNAILHYKSRFDKKDVDSDEYRTLKVRHHPSKGIYVDGLTSVPVRTWAECEGFLQQGNALRTQASTAMNAKSSRSHAIFQLQMTQRESTGGRVRGKEVALETFSKINLVDLAGSERNTQSKTTGKHLAEANSINASLSTLRRVLDGLIANRAIANGGGGGGGAAGKTKKAVVIPYRESLLTYVLSDNLGGNSFTVMCANVSPCAANVGETESTLRYATLARGVVNHAKLNEAPTARVIREMRDQLRVMQEALRTAPDPTHVAELEEGVQMSEELLREMKGREEQYEQELQRQAAQAETLRRSVEAHKQQEAYWKEQAQRQQREVEELREALFEATHNGAGNTATVKAGGPDGGARANGTGMQLPTLTGLTSPPSTQLADDDDAAEDVADAGPASGVTSSKKKTTKAQKQRRSLQSSSNNNNASNGDLLSPASREWKPTRARGTPLSLMGNRDKHRTSQAPLLPTLPGAPASAPEKNRRVSQTTTTVATAPPLGQAGANNKTRLNTLAPKPPLSKPTTTGRRSSSVSNSNANKTKAKDKAGRAGSEGMTNSIYLSAVDVAAGVTDDSAELAQPGPPQRQGQRAASRDAQEEPSFFQTEHFLTPAGGAAAVAAASVDDFTDEAVSNDADNFSDGAVPRDQHPQRQLELHELLDMQQLQSEMNAQHRGSGGGERGGLEIEGVAATPSKQWPTHSPRVAAARQAQAAQDRRRSSLIAVAHTNNNKKAKTKKNVKKQKTSARSAGAEHQTLEKEEEGDVEEEERDAKHDLADSKLADDTAELDDLAVEGRMHLGGEDDAAFPYHHSHHHNSSSLQPHHHHHNHQTGLSASLQDEDDGVVDAHSVGPDDRDDFNDDEMGAESDRDAVRSLRGPFHEDDADDVHRGSHKNSALPFAGEEDDVDSVEETVPEYVEETFADDTESAAASLDRSAKMRDAAPPVAKKKKSKKSKKMRSGTSSDASDGRHYSTVDVLH